MKLKKNIKKKMFEVMIIFLIIILIIINIFKPKNYSINYKINNVSINQRYNKKNKYYKLTYKYKNKVYKTIIYNDNYYKKEIVNKINIEKKDDYTCLESNSTYFKINTICNDDSSYYSYSYLFQDKEETVKEKTYNNIDIFDTNNKTILSWKYNGFNIISNINNKEINIFSKDAYDIPLAYIKDEYLILPNYDEEYEFDEIITYNIKEDKVTTLKLNEPISYNSYIMGSYKDSVYIYDLKNTQEYEFVPYKNKIRKVKTKIINNDSWEYVTDKHIVNKKPKFTDNLTITYKLIDETLYKIIDNYKEIITTDVKYIVKSEGNDVYYLKDDTLYHYNTFEKEEKLLTNFEWSFNYDNMIYIY